MALTLSGDQWMPWGAYDPSGKLRIGFFDRQYDPANHMDGYTLATETSAGSLSFTTTQISTGLSDPTKGSRWSARNVNADFPFANAFRGDYATIAIHPSGGVVAHWMDLRKAASFAGRTGHGEDAVFAAVPWHLAGCPLRRGRAPCADRVRRVACPAACPGAPRPALPGCRGSA